MENLFIPDPSFRQGQYQKLSDNVNEWEEQIYSTLASVVPRRLGLSTTLHWQKVDDQQGYAIGSIVLTEKKSKKSVGIPLIVKQWHLAPLDTMLIGDDKAYPLSDETLKEYFGGGDVANELISRHGPSAVYDSGNQYESTYPPVGGGRYVYSSFQGSLLDEVLKDAWKDDIESFKKSAQASEVLAAAAKNGHYDTFNKVAKTEGKKPSKKAPKRSIVHVQKKGVNEYSVLGNPEGVFDPVMDKVNRPTLKKFVGAVVGPGEAEQAAVSRIDKVQNYQLSGPKEQTGERRNEPPGRKLGEHGQIFLYEEGVQDTASNCDRFGVYGVKDPAGVTSYGFVFPNVVSFDGKKIGVKIFAGKNASCVQSRIAGVHEPAREMELPKTEPEPGKLGTLVHVKDGKALATVPFRVVGFKMYNDTKAATVKDFYGKTVTLVFSPMAEGMTRLEKSKDLGPLASGPTYVIPESMKFVELGPTKKLPESEGDHQKLSMLSHDINPLRITQSNGRYIFRGPDLSKYANVNNVPFDFQNLDRGQAEFLLCSFGCPMQKAAAVVARANGHREVQVHNLALPKVASEVQEDASYHDFVRSLRCDLVKQAAVMEEAEAVDTALSLGFVNPNNVSKFIEAVPKLKECLSLLSKLLVAARLGMSNIPEEATSSAVDDIQRIIAGLRKLALSKTVAAA